MTKSLREDIHDIAVALEKIHQHIKSAAADKDKEHSTPKIRAELYVPQAQVLRNEATATRQEARDRKRVWIEAFALGAAVIYASITAGQWYEMRKATKVSQRAWGEITSKGTENIKLSDITGVVFPEQIANVGNTPAKGVRVETVVEIVSRDKPPSFTYSGISHNATTTSVLFPKETYDFVVTMRRPDNTLAVLTDTERQGLKDGLTYIATYGTVTYRDGFGSHWTRFCWWKSFGGAAFAANQCIAYNDTDE
jgi:hypothetical protein